ncbi:acetylajmaline esterase, partial [Sarracenia purpurea var. burkii]
MLTNFLLLQPSPSNADPLKTCKFDRIYQLGDSISDTGNLIRESPIGAAITCARFPYGESFSKKATAKAANLPFLNPYKDAAADFRHGVNFAVTGATALTVDVLTQRNILPLVTRSSLSVQLGWMSTHFNSICNTHK